jgi:hypothetical protein
MMCGKRKRAPVWKPVPKPIEERIPSPTHHVTCGNTDVS